ncbi:putative RNase H-like HicB family nuclease [Tissierella praeacuta]|uniref:type II toxin-antitoxin system HicB family antitoxin n=1 Tax=Tissierella praeacuta TaxID=43131 RepID=UPI0010437C5E|nr:type II toxin-antitoxin system HicB family antitoxin [Tissierella praeacuta]TCU72812.1 putative RNase H-like HicB family nuclease [Tissierella praeacuta]
MKKVYPVIIYKKEANEEYHVVYVPDLDKTTQGEDIVECIEMARDLIGITLVGLEEDNKAIPEPFTNNNLYAFNDEGFEVEFKTIVDIDVELYKKRLQNRSVKKTLTIPYYLNEAAEKEGINFSQLLQEALKDKLQLQ